MIWFLLPIGLTGTILLTLIGYLHGVDTFRANEHQTEVIALAAISRTGAISNGACEIAIRLGAVECYIDSQSLWVTGQGRGRARAGWPDQ